MVNVRAVKMLCNCTRTPCKIILRLEYLAQQPLRKLCNRRIIKRKEDVIYHIKNSDRAFPVATVACFDRYKFYYH